MTLSRKSIDSFKHKPEQDIWIYVNALQQLQNAVFNIEKNENDPDILKDLAQRALDIGNEITAILKLLEDKIEG
jgi:hypothetical protein